MDFFLYISLYSLGFLRYNFFFRFDFFFPSLLLEIMEFFASCVCVSFDGTCVNEMSGFIVFFFVQIRRVP